MSLSLQSEDLQEFLKIYASEYNKPEFHDRILVFDVVADGLENKTFLAKYSSDEEKTGENLLAVKNPDHKENNIEDDVKPEDENIESETGNTSAQSESTLRNNKETQFGMGDLQSNSKDEINDSTIIRQHKIFVHSSWLAVQSNYFRSFFLSDFKESKSREVHLMVSESEETSHLLMLEAVYNSDILNEASVEDLLAVMELANKYDLRFVFRKCKYVLKTHVTTLDTCRQAMHIIKEKHDFGNVEDLLHTMEETMGNSFGLLEQHFRTEKFTSQSKAFIKHLLHSETLQTGHESTVFQALMHWMEVNNVDPDSLGDDEDFLQSVRFECLSLDYLYNVVKNHPVANKMPGFNKCMLFAMTYHALKVEASLNDIVPRSRQSLPPKTSLFTWIVPSSQFKYNSKQNLTSEFFFLCGYKAKMLLQYHSHDASYYRFLVVLTLLELPEKSKVNLACYINTPNAQLFRETRFNYGEFTHDNPSQSTPQIQMNKGYINQDVVINLRVD
ncbi:uncharacterized protein LOC124454417 isoform X2 [Xenia sp. Carnegie-2017]|uniref:uncharacterized protein LOC124454417 isoform X2 n=1 Tax=Xenia sp. Carnegie-2017 TaxID=2897299 RepID=UPI001F0414DA|nr:uncharacterized protein LOC124454417 isoform X2 [Xenia sp. Carnegie-2017]